MRDNTAGAALIGLLPATSGTFGGVTLPVTVIAGVQFDARNAPSINPSSKLDIETGSLDSTPAATAFCSDVAECPVSVDVFGTDYSLVEAGGGAEGSPFVTEGFWEQLLEDEGGGGGYTSDDEGASLDQDDDGN